MHWRVCPLATVVVFNNSAAEDVVTSPISCPMLFNACRYLWKQGGLGSVQHGARWRGWLWLACSSSPALLFSGRRKIENELESERARVKWCVFRVIDSWLPALRVTSQVYFFHHVWVWKVCVCGHLCVRYRLEPAMLNKSGALWSNRFDTVSMINSRKEKERRRRC